MIKVTLTKKNAVVYDVVYVELMAYHLALLSVDCSVSGLFVSFYYSRPLVSDVEKIIVVVHNNPVQRRSPKG